MRRSLAALCRDRRAELDITQAALAGALGISRSHVASIESGTANPSIDLVDRLAEVLGLTLELGASQGLTILRARVRDAVHARCSGYVVRRLQAAGWLVLREVPVIDGRLRGWIDVLAFDPPGRTLLVIEIKTSLDDLGRLERQVGWYVRVARDHVPADWVPERIVPWVLVLATAEADQVIARQRDVLGQAFPMRASQMGAVVEQDPGAEVGPGLGLIDPRSRRRAWIIPSRTDGRRSPARYQDLAGARRILEG